MSAQILDGKILAEQLKSRIKDHIEQFKKKAGLVPTLVNLMVGKDASAVSYAASQQKTATSLGIDYKLIHLPPEIIQDELVKQILSLNQDTKIHGILLFKPVPATIDYAKVVSFIHPLKDLEGIHEANMGKMILGEAKIIPCTAAAVMAHIQSTGRKLRGLEAVVVGRSEIVGKPVSLLLLEQSATVMICHSGTSDAGHLAGHVGRADILVAAAGKANMIKGEWIKPGAIVIDVGVNRVGEKIVGDVEFEAAVKKASYITPVPGGVGPVTAMMLMQNVLEAFKLQIES